MRAVQARQVVRGVSKGGRAHLFIRWFRLRVRVRVRLGGHAHQGLANGGLREIRRVEWSVRRWWRVAHEHSVWAEERASARCVRGRPGERSVRARERWVRAWCVLVVPGIERKNPNLSDHSVHRLVAAESRAVGGSAASGEAEWNAIQQLCTFPPALPAGLPFLFAALASASAFLATSTLTFSLRMEFHRPAFASERMRILAASFFSSSVEMKHRWCASSPLASPPRARHFTRRAARSMGRPSSGTPASLQRLAFSVSSTNTMHFWHGTASWVSLLSPPMAASDRSTSSHGVFSSQLDQAVTAFSSSAHGMATAPALISRLTRHLPKKARQRAMKYFL